MRDKKIYRIIDANYNRLREGLRVCEDVSRFYCNTSEVTQEYKNIRHQITNLISPLDLPLVQERDVSGDIGQGSIPQELQRKNVLDIFYANSQRSKESLRVLEEFLKLINTEVSLKLKSIRYNIYNIEKKVLQIMDDRLSSLSDRS